MSQDLVQVDNLTIGYRTQRGQMVHVLRRVSLTIRPGEALGLVGESGCGKSTLALALMGFLRPGGQVREGDIHFDQQDLFSLTLKELEEIRGRRVALVPQNAGQSLTPTMRIGAQIIEALTLHTALDKTAARSRAVELLAQVRLPQPDVLVDRYPHELSGGQQQRVAIAMGLAGDPELLILDEPTTGLDVTTQAHILDLLADLRTKTGAAMVYVSHDLGVIARVSDRVAVMYAGEVVENAPAAEFFTNPGHPYAQGLLASIPRLAQARLPMAMPGQPPAPGEHETGCAFAARCPFADDLCQRTDPELELIARGSETAHWVRCHHWSDVAASEHTHEFRDLRRQTTNGTPKKSLVKLADVAITYIPAGFRAYLRRWRKIPEPPATVSDITLTVNQGETLALVGESGSGKSTIVRTIAGLKPPLTGQLNFKALDLNPPVERRPADLRRAVQLIFQNPDASLNPRHTVAQILEQPLRLYFGLNRRQCLERSAALMGQVRLNLHYLDRFPGQLSGGEKQRVAIARAFAAEPELILCDEVTSALDVSVQAAVLELLAELQRERGATYIFISHDLAVVHAIADRVAVLYQGRLCELGPVDQIYSPPYHPYTETLLTAVPDPAPGVRPRLLASDVSEAAPPAKGCPFQRRCPHRLDDICDQDSPPWQSVSEGHTIRCHIPLAELQALQHEDVVGQPVVR